MKQLIAAAVVVFLSAHLSLADEQQNADLRFAKIFGDNMVLQQDKPMRIWGWAVPGADVELTLTQDRELGERRIGEFDVARPAEQDDGEYSVTVQYLEKNPPVLSTQTILTQADGDGRWEVQFESAKASFQPTWIIAESGEKVIVLHNILVGEIWLCAGQSNMTWSNFNRKGREAASADFPGLRYVAWEDSWYKPLDDVRKNISWQECSPETAQRFSAVPYLYGMFLHRYLKAPVGVINVARGGTLGQTWCMREELEGVDNEIIRTVLRDYDVETAIWDDPQQVEQLMAQWQRACDAAKVEHETKVAQAEKEGKNPPRLRLPKQPGDARSGWSPPAGLFNATVMPIRDLSIRGVLYYQGENQAFNRWTRYESTFPKIPVSFRGAFHDDTLSFGCISQPGWGTFGLDPELATVAEGYAIVRDIQRRALKDDPHAGMIATYPTGNSYIHPAEKLPVAEYASLWALANAYDQPVVHRGNVYQKMQMGEGRLYLFFDSDPVVFERWKHIEDNAYWQVLPCPRQGNAELQGFIVAGKDRRWYPAKAKHTKLDGQWCIEVRSDLVADPIAARYGWANWPTGNLEGREGLPVPTFRTDDWPIAEGVDYSPEAKQQRQEELAEMRRIGQLQALDRKLRQLQIDFPGLESELYSGDMAGLLQSKIGRVEAILDELEADNGLSRNLHKNHPDLVERIRDVRDRVIVLRSHAGAIREPRE